MFRPKGREPDFTNFIKMLERKPSRPVLFEFIIGAEKEKALTGLDYQVATEFDRVITTIKAFDSAGYDHAPIIVRGMEFPRKEANHEEKATKSLNEGALIVDWDSYHSYQWPKVENCDFSIIKKASQYLNPKVKFIPFSHDGILENTIGIVGYDNLCLMLYDEPELVEQIFNQVGSRIEQYFKNLLDFDEVGAIICNDDWGFNTQTMLSPNDLRKYVFPWYQRIVAYAHEKNKYAILHSCGYYGDIINDIINVMKFDGRHSYEDKIIPVEKAYDNLKEKIAVIGGIDVDFLARATKEEVYQRCYQMLKKVEKDGGYALGSGNSIPDYIPNENYFAMLQAAHDFNKKENS